MQNVWNEGVMKRKKNSIFKRKNSTLNLIGSILWALFLAFLNFLLLTLLSAASEFLAELVPTNEAWTLVVMVIPITVFGIYVSLLSSNYSQNKNLIIWGKTYTDIKDRRYDGNSFPRSFRINAGMMAAAFVIYFIQLNYPMLIGSALILSVDLFVLIFLEIYEGSKNQIDLYENQFSYHLKTLEDVFLTDVELAKIEKDLSYNDFESAEKIFFAKCVFFDQSLMQLEYELEDFPKPIKKEIWLRFIKFFSLDLKRIENAFFYKRLATEIQRISDNERKNGNNLCANEIILCFCENWVKKANDYYRTMGKRIQKRAPKAKRNSNGLLIFLKETLRHKITFNEFLNIQENILKSVESVDATPNNDWRKTRARKNIENLSDNMKDFNVQIEEMFSLFNERFAKIEEQRSDSTEEVV